MQMPLYKRHPYRGQLKRPLTMAHSHQRACSRTLPQPTLFSVHLVRVEEDHDAPLANLVRS